MKNKPEIVKLLGSDFVTLQSIDLPSCKICSSSCTGDSIIFGISVRYCSLECSKEFFVLFKRDSSFLRNIF